MDDARQHSSGNSPEEPINPSVETNATEIHQQHAQRRHGGHLETAFPQRTTSRSNGNLRKHENTQEPHNDVYFESIYARLRHVLGLAKLRVSQWETSREAWIAPLLRIGLLEQRILTPTSPTIPREFAKGHVSHPRMDPCMECLSSPFHPYTISWTRILLYLNVLWLVLQLLSIPFARMSCWVWENPATSSIVPCNYPGGGVRLVCLERLTRQTMSRGYVPLCENMDRIPRVAHFILFPQHRFSFLNYLAVKSARTFLSTELVFLHIVEHARTERDAPWMPSGVWWDLVRNKVTVSRMLIGQVTDVTVDLKRFPFALDFLRAGTLESHPEDGTHLHALASMDGKAPQIIQRELELLLVSAQVLHRSGGVVLGLTTVLTGPIDHLLVHKTVVFHSDCEAEFKRNILLSAPQTETMLRWKRALMGEWYAMDGWVGSVDGKGGWRTLLNRIARFNPEEMTSRPRTDVHMVDGLEFVEALRQKDGIAIQVVSMKPRTEWKVRQQEWELVRHVVSTSMNWTERVLDTDLARLRSMLTQNRE